MPEADAASAPGAGGVIITMLPHLGHSESSPIARSSRTFSLAPQVVQEME
jgi:hypothetical protein